MHLALSDSHWKTVREPRDPSPFLPPAMPPRNGSTLLEGTTATGAEGHQFTTTSSENQGSLLPPDWRQKLVEAAVTHGIKTGVAVDRLEIAQLISEAGPAQAIRDIAVWTNMQINDLIQVPDVRGMKWFRLAADASPNPKAVIDEFAWHEGDQPLQRQMNVIDDFGRPIALTVTKRAIGINETKFDGETRRCTQINLDVNDQWKEYTALWHGAIHAVTRMPVVDPNEPLLLRFDSGCFSGMVLGDCQCDCCQQFHLAKKQILEAKQGLILEIPNQDGRGMGGDFKTKTLGLQSVTGIDNVTAARLLARSNMIDQRTYAGALAVLQFLGITADANIHFMTNNVRGRPEDGIASKTDIFRQNGYLLKRVPLISDNAHTIATHLRAKGDFLGHVFDDDTLKGTGGSSIPRNDSDL